MDGYVRVRIELTGWDLEKVDRRWAIVRTIYAV